ncbi:MAG TPA: sigma 54-interacting transcriptional regulator [Polyangia bacterium]|nr:sigma 54-interacting transcriptional regulator [Polyangia bacterium]
MGDATRLLEVTDGKTLTMAGARLVVVRGPDTGASVRLESEETTVGTGAGATLVLTDATVSRHHVSLQALADGWLVTDLDSTNGTRLDGRRIRAAYVAPGDKIQLGATTLRLEADKRAVDLALSERGSFGRLIGKSVAARRLFALLERVAPETATVLLSGETGSGKDLAAEALHEAGPRAAGPFVVVDCGALVDNLLESELFGHEKGAFTGAVSARAGAFEQADGGTLFLDEIGELPRDLQPKLLRVLERREIRRIGAIEPRAVDVRILAATNRDLKVAVNQGLFREDLFHRINVVSIRVPPLRERMDDVPLLAEHLWREQTGDPHEVLPDALRSAFLAYHWPGNVRELRNKVERAAMLVRAGRYTDALSGIGEVRLDAPFPFREAKAAAIESFERTYLKALLERARGNISEAARIAAMDRVHLTRLVQKHQLGKR